MKDVADTKTIDALPVTPKRGRPSTGNAMTPAQRKALQRARAVRVVGPFGDITNAPVTSILEELAIAVRSGDIKTTERACKELAARAKKNRDSHKKA